MLGIGDRRGLDALSFRKIAQQDFSDGLGRHAAKLRSTLESIRPRNREHAANNCVGAGKLISSIVFPMDFLFLAHAAS